MELPYLKYINRYLSDRGREYRHGAPRHVAWRNSPELAQTTTRWSRRSPPTPRYRRSARQSERSYLESRVAEVEYVRTRDAIDHSERPMSQRRSIYAAVVARVALRTLHELFEADRAETIDTVVFNGFVITIAPATGKPITPHLVTVRASRERFAELDLAAVEPLACLKGLNASVSPNPAELVPFRPILEFNMVDRRFVEESDVLSSLDQRPKPDGSHAW